VQEEKTMNGNKTDHIKFLAEILGIPLVKIIWWSNGWNSRNWGLVLENGLTGMLTSEELMTQNKFQTKLIGVGVLPLDVCPCEWKEIVVQRIIQAAEPFRSAEDFKIFQSSITDLKG
jgi:hypothetical protein